MHLIKTVQVMGGNTLVLLSQLLVSRHTLVSTHTYTTNIHGFHFSQHRHPLDTKLTTLGIDSLKAISVLFELEEAFDVEIPNEVISSIVTVDDIMTKLHIAHS